MALCVIVSRIKREPFLNISDFYSANYHEIIENILPYFKGIDELSEYPSMSEVRRYVERQEGEDKDSYYDRALEVLPQLKERYSKYQDILKISTQTQEYLEDYSHYESLFFDKRCYELANELNKVFESDFEESEDLPILLDSARLEVFNRLTNREIVYDKNYIYKLSVG